MKSRIKLPEKSLIIGYMISDDNIKNLKTIASLSGSEIKFTGMESAADKVGYLAGFSGFEKSDAVVENPPSDEVLILSGFNNKSMDRLLTLLRKYNTAIPLKCIVTQHNQSWELYKLIDELKKEHAQMKNNNR